MLQTQRRTPLLVVSVLCRFFLSQVPVEEAKASLGQALVQGLRAAQALAEGQDVDAMAAALPKAGTAEDRPPR